MHADLVRASRFEMDRHEARASQAFDGLVAGHRGEAPLSGAGNPAPAVGPIAHEVGIERAGVRRLAPDEGHVLALDFVALEDLLERPERFAAPREDERSGRVLVDPVDDADIRPAAVAVLG